MLISKLQNAPSCTGLNLYLHKFPGGNTPGPQNRGGGKPTFSWCARPPSHLFSAFVAGRCPQLEVQTCNVTLPTAVIFSYTLHALEIDQDYLAHTPAGAGVPPKKF